jgi:hypothetical protein
VDEVHHSVVKSDQDVVRTAALAQCIYVTDH